MKVIISEACDGFTIILSNGENAASKHYWFSQEDDKKNLVEVSRRLGYETEYEENY